MNGERDGFSPREIADRLGFSYHAVLRAIRRGELRATEPIAGQYRIAPAEYERWRDTPIRPRTRTGAPRSSGRRSTKSGGAGSYDALTAVEKTG